MEEQILNEEMQIEETTVESAPTEKQKTGTATAALVLGILALITTLVVVNYVFGIIAIILGTVFLVAKRGQKAGRAKAIVGLVLALVSIIASTVLWVNVYNYLTKTPLTQMMEDVKVITGGQVDPGKIVDEAINSYVEEAIDSETLAQVETILGRDLSYEAISEFVGEEVSVDRVVKFLDGKEIKAEEVQEVMAKLDEQAVANDLGGKLTYDALESKLGKDFTYDDLMEYLEDFKK